MSRCHAKQPDVLFIVMMEVKQVKLANIKTESVIEEDRLLPLLLTCLLFVASYQITFTSEQDIVQNLGQR